MKKNTQKSNQIVNQSIILGHKCSQSTQVKADQIRSESHTHTYAVLTRVLQRFWRVQATFS